MPTIEERIEDGIAALRKNPDLTTYGVDGENTILLRVRNQKLQAKQVLTSSLKRNPEDTEISPALIHRHKSYVDVAEWRANKVLHAESVLKALEAQAA